MRTHLSAVLIFAITGIAHCQDLYVTSNGTASVLKYNGSTGALLGTFVSGGSGGFE